MTIGDRVRSAIQALSPTPPAPTITLDRKQREDAVIANTGSFWSSETTGLGTTGHDPMSTFLPGAPAHLGAEVLADLYVGDPLAAVIVGAIVDDALRGGFEPMYVGESESEAEKTQAIKIRHRKVRHHQVDAVIAL